MSWKAFSKGNITDRVGRTCPVCGKHFFARSHQRMCQKCKQIVGRRKVGKAV